MPLWEWWQMPETSIDKEVHKFDYYEYLFKYCSTVNPHTVGLSDMKGMVHHSAEPTNRPVIFSMTLLTPTSYAAFPGASAAATKEQTTRRGGRDERKTTGVLEKEQQTVRSY